MKDRLEKEYYTWNVKDFYFGGGGVRSKCRKTQIQLYLLLSIYPFISFLAW